MDPLTIVGMVFAAIVLLYIGKIVSFLTKVLFVIAIVLLIVVLVFGVSYDQAVSWVTNVILYRF